MRRPAAVAAAGAQLVTLAAALPRADVLSLHAPDLPATRHMIGAVELAAGADVLIHDAQLLAEEVAAQAAFGHAAADYVVGLARRAGARSVVLFHHQPDRTDDALDRLANRFAASPVPVAVAAEETTLEI